MMIASPLNYTGGKYKLLPQILPLFPRRIKTFLDLFCGGCNVGINVSAEKVIYNDANEKLFWLYRIFKNLGSDEIIKRVEKVINDYGLSQASKYGYEFYHCESGDGLALYNKVPFLKLRNEFNTRINKRIYDDETAILLYVLIVYAFNNQIRFNSQGEFNLPVGKRDFNDRMRIKLTKFILKLQSQECTFSSRDFRDIDISNLGADDFVYADPPYLITCATYNENGGWSAESEIELLSFLDALNERGIPFALSNVLKSKGKENSILLRWIEQSAYTVHHLNYSYANANYHTIDKTTKSDEVLIVNYKGGGNGFLL